MPQDFADQLMEALPAGIWAELTPRDAGGMMAHEGGAVHFTARWIPGNRPSHLKCFPSRGESASATAASLVGHERLVRLRARLERLRNQRQPFVVDIFAVEELNNPPALLVAMELVTQLRDRPPDAALAHQVLEQLGTRDDQTAWIHFDICPKNTGITADNRLVLIDPDSMYQVEGPQVGISLPAFKSWRLPIVILRELQQALSSGLGLPLHLAQKKHNAEVIVLAAECCLGWSGRPLEEWVANSNASPELRTFWDKELASLLQGRVDSPLRVLDRLRKVSRSTSASAPAIAAEAPPDDSSLARATQWESLAGWRRALRLDQLRGGRLLDYKRRLLALAEANPSDKRWWQELLLVSVAYERSPVAAKQIVEAALKQHPDDAGFALERQVIEVWLA